jgi:hypothetical protein
MEKQPSLEEVMQALRNADAAGNTADAQKLAAIAASMTQQVPEQAQVETPAAEMSALQRFVQAAKPGSFTKEKMLRFMESAKPEPFTEAVARGMFADPGIAIGQLASRGVGFGQEQMDRLAAENEQRMSQLPGSGRFVGNVLSPVSAVLAKIPGAASKIPGLGGTTLPQTAARAAITGGVGAPLISPATSDDFGQEKMVQAMFGGALGPVFDIAAAPLARLGSPSANQELARLQQRGIDVSQFTPGQQLGGAAKRIEEAAGSIPLAGSLVREAEKRGFQEFNRGMIQSVVDQVNPQIKIPQAFNVRGSIGFAEKQIKDAYNKSLVNMKITPDPNFKTNVLSVVAKYGDELGEDNIARLDKIIQNKVIKLVPDTRPLTGGTAKRIDQDLGRLVSSNLRSQDPQDFAIGQALAEVQQSVRGMIAKQDKTGQIEKANAAFADFLRIQRAAAKSTRDDGIFTPEQLTAAVRELDPTRRKGAYARGEARLQQSAEAARNVLGSRVPDSGTGERATTMGALTGLGAALYYGGIPEQLVSPLLTAGGLGALYSRPGQYLTRQAAKAGPGLRELSPIVGPATLQSLLD